MVLTVESCDWCGTEVECCRPDWFAFEEGKMGMVCCDRLECRIEAWDMFGKHQRLEKPCGSDRR